MHVFGTIVALVAVTALAPGPSRCAAQDPPLRWHDLDDGLLRAAEEGRPVLVYVRAPWCGPCYRLENSVFPALEDVLRRVVLVKIDLTNRPAPGQVADRSAFNWIDRQGLVAPPSLALLAPDGSPQVIYRGFLPASHLRPTLLAAIDSD